MPQVIVRYLDIQEEEIWVSEEEIALYDSGEISTQKFIKNNIANLNFVRNLRAPKEWQFSGVVFQIETENELHQDFDGSVRIDGEEW